MTITFRQYHAKVAQTLETHLQLAVSYQQNTAADMSRLWEAMAYSLLNGGKRLRALLVVSAYESISNQTANSAVYQLACAVECIHAYSLIHDDLPAMDDDDLRRGKPTNHIAYGDATAILAGDALQTLAFELICEGQLPAEKSLQCVRTLAKASGALGMVGGQQFDLSSENQALSLDELRSLHEHKTGALIQASLALGGIAAGATEQELEQLQQYGRKIGLAFQVVDDILDIESDTETLGKQQGADIAMNKATYPSLMGLEEAKQYAQALVHDAKQYLDEIAINQHRLYEIADFVLSRQN